MIKHSFKLIWNQRKQNTYLIIELFLIFVLLFLNGTYLIEQASNYWEGTGTNVENVTYIWLQKNEPTISEDINIFNALKDELRSIEAVKSVTFNCSASPYTFSAYSGKVKAGKEEAYCHLKAVDDTYDNVFQSSVIEGRWFTAKDTSMSIAPTVITEKTAQHLFGKVSALNKEFTLNNQQFRIVGIVKRSKRNDYEEERYTVFIPITRSYWVDDDNRSELAIRTNPESALNIQEVVATIRRYLPASQYSIRQLADMEKMKRIANSYRGSDVLMALGIMLFLIINMVLGMIGIIGYRVKLRREEMAVRMAMGATAKKISRQIRVEMYLLCLLSIIPALLMAIQIPLLDLFPVDDSLFYIALGSAILFIYLLVAIAVWYPARSILRIEPALALKEE